MAVSPVAAIVAGVVLGGIVCCWLAAIAWRRREVPAALPFGALMLAVAAWSFADATFILAGTTEAAYVADRMLKAASAQVPPLWVLFVLAFAGYEEWVTWRTVALLWIVPTAYVVAVVTAPLLGLASTPADVLFVTRNGLREPVVVDALATDLHLLYAYGVMGLGYAVLGSFLVRSRAMYRRQTALIVLGSVAPAVVNVGLQMGLTPHPGLDLTPLAFVVSGVIFGWSLVRYDFLSVTPLAGDVLVDQLPDPVLLLDDDDRVSGYNPAAEDAFETTRLRRRPVEAVDPALSADVQDGDAVTVESPGGQVAHYQASVTRLEDQYGTARDTLLLLREVTGQRRRQNRLEALQSATRQFLEASTDEAIADICVEYADTVLATHATAVFLADGEDLRPVATTDTAETAVDGDGALPSALSEVIERAYDSGEPASRGLPAGGDLDADRAFAVPLGDHGVLLFATVETDAVAPDDEGFAKILARTTQVALTRVERESELRRSRSSVERRSEQIAFFNGVLRHTLRNALLVIEGRAEHLRAQVDDDETGHVDTIVDWCEDLDALSEEIRAINDTVTATESERLDTVDLSAMLYDAVDRFRAEHDAVTIETDVDPNLPVRANELAARAIDSVVENAIVHNDRADPHVEVRTVRAADRVQVHVADDGPGMDDEMKAVVFERDLSANQTASGFGLYFVTVLMNLYGGTVYFEDNTPRGTVAVLEFQAADDGEATADAATADGGTGDSDQE